MKPTFTKVYSGPGYPIDPKKEEARVAWIVSQDAVVQMLFGVDPGGIVETLYSCTIKAINGVTFVDSPWNSLETIKAKKKKSVAEIIAIGAFESFFPTKPSKPKCYCPACNPFKALDEAVKGMLPVMKGVLHESNRHERRYKAIQSDDFRSKLAAIEAKDRKSH